MPELNVSIREVYRFGAFRLDVPARRLTRADEPVALPPKAFELLQLLVRNADRAMTRTELLDAVWRDTIVEEGSLGWNMSVLRRALDDADGTLIETVRGYGYRLAVAVERESASRTESSETFAETSVLADGASLPSRPVGGGESRETLPAEEQAAGVAAGSATSADERKPKRTPDRRPLLLIALLAVAIAALVVARIVRRDASESPAPSASAGDRRPIVAVLPFENLSKRPADAWLSIALAELLTSELVLEGRTTTLPGESVARVTSDLRLHSSAGLERSTVARLEERLGFDDLVTGTFLVVGEPPVLRVDVQLRDASRADPKLAWTESRPLAELPTLASSAGMRLRSVYGGEAGAERTSAARSGSVESLRLYAEGIDLRRRFQLGAARERFERAVAESPDLVVARAALADLLGELGQRRRALEESRRALAQSGSLAPRERLPIEARNRELEGRWADGAELWKKVVALDPEALEPSLSLARALSRAGRHEEARAVLDELARRPAPAGNSPRILLERGWVERYAQDDLGAMRQAGVAAAALGRSLPSDYVLAEGLAIVAWAEWALGEEESALAACTEGADVSRRIEQWRLLAAHLHRCGWIEWSRAGYAAAERWFGETVRVAEPEGDLDSLAGGLLGLGWSDVDRGRLSRAGEAAAKALTTAREAGDGLRESNALELTARIAYDSGELERAESLTLEGLATARAINVRGQIAIQLNALGRIRRARGDATRAVEAHEEAVRVQPAMSAAIDADFELELGRSRLAAGDAAGALEIGDRALARLSALPASSLDRYRCEAFVARAEALLGRTDAARERLERLERSGADLSAPPNGLDAQLERAELLFALGRKDDARAAWRAVLEAPAFREERLALDTARKRLAAS